VVEEIDVATADRMLASGTLEGGIIPKLSSAVDAARTDPRGDRTDRDRP